MVLETVRNRKVHGVVLPTTPLRWENGTTELLRPVGQHYVTMLYSPLKNLDSIPDRVCPIEPYDRWSLKLPSLFASDEDVQ